MLYLKLHQALRSSLFPYTTLFRSKGAVTAEISTAVATCTVATSTYCSKRGSAEAMIAGVTIELPAVVPAAKPRSEEHTSELQSRGQLVCRRLLAKKNTKKDKTIIA